MQCCAATMKIMHPTASKDKLPEHSRVANNTNTPLRVMTMTNKYSGPTTGPLRDSVLNEWKNLRVGQN